MTELDTNETPVIVTPAMIVAGVNEYCLCVQDAFTLKDSEAVIRIFRAMAQEIRPNFQR